MAKVTETPAGKIGIAIVAVVAVVIALFVILRVTTGGGDQVADDKQVKANAQQQIDILQKNTTMPPALKAEEIAHAQGLLNGHNKGAGGPAPTGGQ